MIKNNKKKPLKKKKRHPTSLQTLIHLYTQKLVLTDGEEGGVGDASFSAGDAWGGAASASEEPAGAASSESPSEETGDFRQGRFIHTQASQTQCASQRAKVTYSNDYEHVERQHLSTFAKEKERNKKHVFFIFIFLLIPFACSVTAKCHFTLFTLKPEPPLEVPVPLFLSIRQCRAFSGGTYLTIHLSKASQACFDYSRTEQFWKRIEWHFFSKSITKK